MKSLLLLLGITAFSYILNKILLKFSNNFGVESRQNQQSRVRWGSTSKPTTGGISFYISFLLGSLILLIIEPSMISEGHTSSAYLALFLSATLAFLIGFADDAYGTHPGAKFGGQVVCALILIGFGIHINYFSYMSEYGVWLDYMLTIFWVVGLMNSLNMLDNMDAVTATIASTIVMITMVMVISRQSLSPMFSVLTIIVGGFIGFLFWNWRPAKIYMGDTGSMFIGLTLAFFGIEYFWNLYPSPDNISYARMLLIPVLVFIVPIMDTTFVTFSRLSRGISPFTGGKDHLTHNLARIGIPENMVPVTLGIVSVISGSLGFFAFKLTPEWKSFYSVLFALYPILLFGLFTYLYMKGMRILRMKELLAAREAAKLERKEAVEEKELVIENGTR
ncbi:MAG: undecaprenyl/decaprenyl-phosphate alpha-N-acetylglucosaminyl 1-phosphate transferase [Bacteroidia bacterium]|nr:undecaprenyl/decaprenyl-phosphate alpha-N-acetylglucosaminyl 1-phosphate transferase [Bacteroidia bacterium]